MSKNLIPVSNGKVKPGDSVEVLVVTETEGSRWIPGKFVSPSGHGRLMVTHPKKRRGGVNIPSDVFPQFVRVPNQ